MKKQNLKRIVTIGLIAASIFTIVPIGASAEWKQNSTGWWYSEGNSWATGWKQINGKWYYFDSNGYMAKNTQIGTYKLGSDGAWIRQNSINQTLSLTKEDFNRNIENKSGQAYNNLIDYWKSIGYTWGTEYIYESSTNKKEDPTSKNISINASLTDVLQAYGDSELKTVSQSDLFYKYPNWQSDPLTKYLEYTYYENVTQYNIRFYFDSANKLKLFAYNLNEDTFPKDTVITFEK